MWLLAVHCTLENGIQPRSPQAGAGGLQSMEEGGMGMGWEGGMVDLCHVMGPNRHLVDQNKQTEKQNISLEQGLTAGWG